MTSDVKAGSAASKGLTKLDFSKSRTPWQHEQGLSYCGSPQSRSAARQPPNTGYLSERAAYSARAPYLHNSDLPPHGSQTARVTSTAHQFSGGPRSRIESAKASRAKGQGGRAPASNLDIRPQSARVPGYTGHQPGIVSESLVGR